MTPDPLMARAIQLSGLSTRQFARQILPPGTDYRRARRYKAGHPMPPSLTAFLEAYIHSCAPTADSVDSAP